MDKMIFLVLLFIGIVQNGDAQSGNQTGRVTNTNFRLSGLRSRLAQNTLNAYIVPSADFHLSEFVSDYDRRVEYISGFTGSAGTAVITLDKAALWTDGRYFVQAESQLGCCDWTLMKDGESGVPSIGDWLVTELSNKTDESSPRAVGACPYYFRKDEWTRIDAILRRADIKLKPIVHDVIDQLWVDSRPAFPSTPINALPLQFAGKKWEEKVKDVEETLQQDDVDVLVLTSLDEIAWLFNMRGTDITGFVNDPFFYSFAIIERPVKSKKAKDNIRLYLKDHKEKLSSPPTDPATNITVAEHLHLDQTGACDSDPCVKVRWDSSGRMKFLKCESDPCVKVLEYTFNTFINDLTSLVRNKTVMRVWISHHCNYGVYNVIPSEKVRVANTPVTLMKARKNAVEVKGMKNAHIKDAAAVVRFMAKLEPEVRSGANWSEMSAAEELSRFRRMQQDSRGDSFAAISSVGTHAAINHYTPTPETNVSITTDQFYLLDSGGQYLFSTVFDTRRSRRIRPSRLLVMLVVIIVLFVQILTSLYSSTIANLEENLAGSERHKDIIAMLPGDISNKFTTANISSLLDNVEVRNVAKGTGYIRNLSKRNGPIETHLGADRIAAIQQENNVVNKQIPDDHKNSRPRFKADVAINRLCDMFRRDVITGSMCDHLCNLNTIHATLKDDYGDTTGKHVYILNCNGCVPDSRVTTVVIKLFLTRTWENETNDAIATFDTLEMYEEHLNIKITASAKQHYGSIVPSVPDALSVMWGEALDTKTSKTDRLKIIRSITGLLGQDTDQEYLALRLLQNASFIPRLYGTCGSAYFMEYADTLRNLGYVYHRDRPFEGPQLSWDSRAEVALKLLQVTQDMDSVFNEHLRLCDVRRSHFGLARDGHIVIIDMDDLKYDGDFSRKFVFRQFKTTCNGDEDCKFNACYAKCNWQTRTCDNGWKNNNLQMMCARLFTSFPQTPYGIIQRYGLLRDPHPALHNLSAVLQRCNALRHSTGEEQLRINTQAVYNQLKEILSKSIST